MEKQRTYVCIDLKTFYASVECAERGLDPFKTNLVVADPSRGKGAICLAITPHMKALGVQNRCRIYEIPQTMDYITALPRMNLYIQYSANIYSIYLKYVAKEDIHVYSIDEAFLDLTSYLSLYHLSPLELAKKIINDIYTTLGITATAGVGTNLFLAKIALDLLAKKAKDRIAFLDESTYQYTLWHHRPIDDFWQIGPGITRRLARMGIVDMYQLALANEEALYKEFGINAEFLIDHAWGREPCTIDQIKNYEKQAQSVSLSQILYQDYPYEKAFIVMKEMVELCCLDLTDRQRVAHTVFLGIGYSKDEVKMTGGSMKLTVTTNSYSVLLPYFIDLFKRTTRKETPIRRIVIGFPDVKDEAYEQYDFFTDSASASEDKKIQETINLIKQKYGKNAVLKGINLLEGATTKRRNGLVGGHNAE